MRACHRCELASRVRAPRRPPAALDPSSPRRPTGGVGTRGVLFLKSTWPAGRVEHRAGACCAWWVRSPVRLIGEQGQQLEPACSGLKLASRRFLNPPRRGRGTAERGGGGDAAATSAAERYTPSRSPPALGPPPQWERISVGLRSRYPAQALCSTPPEGSNLLTGRPASRPLQGGRRGRAGSRAQRSGERSGP